MKIKKHTIYSYELETSSVVPYAENSFENQLEAYHTFTKAVELSFNTSNPVKILWKNPQGRTVAEFSFKLPL